jgi:hypothetical protein
MDVGSSTHPNPESLQEYGLGRLDDTGVEVVSNHLKDCADCRRQVTEMTGANFAGPAESSIWLTRDDAGLDSASSPCMSSTGQVDVTSDVRSSPVATSVQPVIRVGYFGDYELLNVLGERLKRHAGLKRHAARGDIDG